MEFRWRSLVLTWCCGWPWRQDKIETPKLAKLRLAKCIYEGISLHMYFASTRIWKGTEPLSFLLNCFVVVETKGEMQFRARCFNIFAKRAMRVDILCTIFCGNSRTVPFVDLMLWLTVKTRYDRNPWIGQTKANPRSAKCIYEGISLHMYFASTRILKGTEPLAFLLNCFVVVVETKGEMQFRARCFNFFAKGAMRVDILFCGNPRTVPCVDLMLWLTVKTRCDRTPWIGWTQA